MKNIILLLSLLLPSLNAIAITPYASMQTELRALVQAYPSEVSLFELTQTRSKIVVEGVTIKGSNPSIAQQLVVGAHHGNEWGSVQVVLAFAKSLAAQPIEGRTVHVIPVLIPEGYNGDVRNVNGINPNRDYPGPCGSHDGDGSKSAFALKPTRALSNFIVDKNISTALTVHNPWGTLHYPWSDQMNAHTDDHQIFADLFELAYKNTQYTHSTVPDRFYTMKGNFVDYVFWEFGVWGFLVEIAGGKWPSPDVLKSEIKINLPAFRKLLKNAPISRSFNHGHPGCEKNLLGPIMDAME